MKKDLDDLNSSEIKWIKIFGSFGSNGYNLNSGGNFCDHLNTKEVNDLKISRYGEIMGACRTEEALCKMRLAKSIGFLSDSIYENIRILKDSNLELSSYNYIYHTKSKIFRHLIRVFNKINYLRKEYWWTEFHEELFSEIYNYCYEKWPEWTFRYLGKKPLLN